MTEGSGKTGGTALGTGIPTVALLVGAGVSVATGTLLPLLIAFGIAILAGGSSRVPPDVELGPPPGGPICDFCYQRPVEWSYPCRDFSIRIPESILNKIRRDTGREVPIALQGINSRGPWAADQPCYVLIERDDWDGMFDRYWQVSPSGYALRAIGFSRMHAKEWTGELWAGFKNNRTGPPYRVGPFGAVPRETVIV